MNSGRVQPAEEKAKQKAAMIGTTRAPFSDEWKNNLSRSRIGNKNSMYGKKHSTETIEKIKVKAIGRKQSPETIAKKSSALIGGKRSRIVCEYCNKDVAVNIYAKNHGIRCKFNPVDNA